MTDHELAVLGTQDECKEAALMAKPKLTAITIRPSKGGGHKVTHEYASTPAYSAGKNGGMSMNQSPPAEHNFAPGEHNALLNHIASALALKGMGMQNPGQGAGTGAGNTVAGMPPEA